MPSELRKEVSEEKGINVKVTTSVGSTVGKSKLTLTVLTAAL
jgi:hypothetical protein